MKEAKSISVLSLRAALHSLVVSADPSPWVFSSNPSLFFVFCMIFLSRCCCVITHFAVGGLCDVFLGFSEFPSGVVFFSRLQRFRGIGLTFFCLNLTFRRVQVH